jgi:hypothetical protein
VFGAFDGCGAGAAGPGWGCGAIGACPISVLLSLDQRAGGRIAGIDACGSGAAVATAGAATDGSGADVGAAAALGATGGEWGRQPSAVMLHTTANDRMGHHRPLGHRREAASR